MMRKTKAQAAELPASVSARARLRSVNQMPMIEMTAGFHRIEAEVAADNQNRQIGQDPVRTVFSQNRNTAALGPALALKPCSHGANL